MSDLQIEQRIEQFERRDGVRVGQRLGAGAHGTVYAATSHAAGRSAVKFHQRREHYQRERDVYFRLTEHRVRSIAGCAVPQLVRCDDTHSPSK